MLAPGGSTDAVRMAGKLLELELRVEL